MIPKFVFLFLCILCWSSGHGYFFSGWKSKSAESPQAMYPSHSGFGDYRAHRGSASLRLPPTLRVPFTLETHQRYLVASAIPWSIAVQIPHQILPLSMYNTIRESVQPIKVIRHPIASYPTTLLQPTPSVPFVKVSPHEVRPLNIPAVRLVPCFCTASEDQRLTRAEYQALGYPDSTPIHLLPCYCPMVRPVGPPIEVARSVPTKIEPSSDATYQTSTTSSNA